MIRGEVLSNYCDSERLCPAPPLVTNEESNMREKLIMIRQQAGISQERMAAELNISLQYYQDIESHKRRPAPYVSRKIAKALGMTGARIDGFIDAVIFAEDEDEYLTTSEFIQEFALPSETEAYRLTRAGMPSKIIDGKRMYPKERCHMWYAGELRK
jgi:transcriptional regulator with XRE-family HTH domain